MRKGRLLSPKGVTPGTMISAESYKCRMCRNPFPPGSDFTIVNQPKRSWWGCVDCGVIVKKFNDST